MAGHEFHNRNEIKAHLTAPIAEDGHAWEITEVDQATEAPDLLTIHRALHDQPRVIVIQLPEGSRITPDAGRALLEQLRDSLAPHPKRPRELETEVRP